MTNSLYQAGVIGLGFIGGGDQISGDALGQKVANLDGTHREALSKHPEIELVAGASRDEGQCERFAERTGARVYADWAEMLCQERLDIVSVATYTHVRPEIVQACAESGARAIYAEKPMAQTLADAEEMLSACDKSGALLVINHNRRFNPNYQRLRDLVAAGGLGDLTSVSLQWGAGRLGNTGTHLIDAARMLTGREILAVSATLDLAGKPDCRGPEFHDPGGWGVLRFAGGLMGTLDAGDYAKTPPSIVLNGTLGRATTGRDEVTLEYWDGARENWPSLRSQATSMDRAVAAMMAWLKDGT